MPDFQQIDGSNLNDNELIRQSLTFGYNINKLNRIPIFDILKSAFKIDAEKRDFIVSKIIHHNIARYSDNEQNDILINIDGINAIQTNNPIEYMKKLESDKHRSVINGENIIVGNNNTGNNQGRGLSVFPQIKPDTKPNQNATPIDITEVKISKAQFIFWLFTALTVGISIGYMVFNIINKQR